MEASPEKKVDSNIKLDYHLAHGKLEKFSTLGAGVELSEYKDIDVIERCPRFKVRQYETYGIC
jgi:hypothetical protein